MMRSKKIIIGQKYVTSDRDSLKLTIHLNWSKTSLPCKTGNEGQNNCAVFSETGIVRLFASRPFFYENAHAYYT